MDLMEGIFLILSIISAASAILAMESKSLVYATLGLAVLSICISGLYLILGAAYITAFQIAVYVGAVVGLILFTVMLFPPLEIKKYKVEELLGGIAAGLFIIVIGLGISLSSLYLLKVPYTPSIEKWLSSVSRDIVEHYPTALLLLSLVLASSLVGGITIAKSER